MIYDNIILCITLQLCTETENDKKKNIFIRLTRIRRYALIFATISKKKTTKYKRVQHEFINYTILYFILG